MGQKWFDDKVRYYSALDSFKEYLTYITSASSPMGGENLFKVIGNRRVYLYDVHAPFKDSIYLLYVFTNENGASCKLTTNLYQPFINHLADAAKNNYAFSFDSAVGDQITIKAVPLTPEASLENPTIASYLSNAI